MSLEWDRTLISSAGSPFTDFPGEIPRVWAGRDSILEYLMPTANESWKWGTSDLLIGASGLGKTSLLRWCAQRATDVGRPAIRLTISGETATPRGFAAAIEASVDALRAKDSVVQRAAQAAKRLPIRPTTPWTEYVERAEESGGKAVRSALGKLEELATELSVSALLVVDEIHALNTDAADALTTVLASEEKSNIQIVAAGLSSAWDGLVFETATPAVRLFTCVELDLLKAAEAEDCIIRTLATADAEWPDAVVRAAVQASGGSPSRVQEVGNLLWRLGADIQNHSLVEAALMEFTRKFERELVRFLSRLPVSAIRVVRTLAIDGTRDGLPLLALRATATDDVEFKKAIDLLERSGLVMIDPDQVVRMTVESPAIARVLALPSDAPKSLEGR